MCPGGQLSPCVQKIVLALNTTFPFGPSNTVAAYLPSLVPPPPPIPPPPPPPCTCSCGLALFLVGDPWLPTLSFLPRGVPLPLPPSLLLRRLSLPLAVV